MSVEYNEAENAWYDEDDDFEPSITACICCGEGCKLCDNTGVIYP